MLSHMELAVHMSFTCISFVIFNDTMTLPVCIGTHMGEEELC